MSKKILILGAGNAQIDLIEHCNSLGLETHGVSYTNTDKGIGLLSHFEQINIVDTEKVCDYFIKNNIDYIYSVGSDIAVPTFTRVSEQTGAFCFVSSQTAEICCNKHLMRKALEGSAFNLPYAVCESIQDAKDAELYPLMLKPVDSQGQRGVFLINNRSELEERFEASKSYSKSGKVILEKYVDGDEISVNAYIKDGKVIFSIISDRESFRNFPGGIIKAHHLPSKYDNTSTEDRVNELVADTVKRLDIKNGPVYFQIKTDKGYPYVIEVTPRLDGCHMWRLIKSFCGVDLLSLTLRHLLNEDISIESYRKSTAPMHLEFYCKPTDSVFDPQEFEGLSAGYSRFYYEKGDRVRRLNGYMEKCGYRIYKSPERVALVGGSGFVGKAFAGLYNDTLNILSISRSDSNIKEYSQQELASALDTCDSIVILAAKKVSPDEEQSLMLYNDNVTMVENTLKAAVELGIKNIVFASSRCVYSNTQASPISENGEIKPINFYGESKLAGEKLCEKYSRKYGLNIKVLRFAQIIGNDKNGYVIDKFMENAKSGAPLTVFGKAQGKRDYIYIKDACKAILKALEATDKSDVYNIASGAGTSILELAGAVKSGFGSGSDIITDESKAEDTSVTYFDTSKAYRELGFACDYSLTQAFEDLSDC